MWKLKQASGWNFSGRMCRVASSVLGPDADVTAAHLAVANPCWQLLQWGVPCQATVNEEQKGKSVILILSAVLNSVSQKFRST